MNLSKKHDRMAKSMWKKLPILGGTTCDVIDYQLIKNHDKKM